MSADAAGMVGGGGGGTTGPGARVCATPAQEQINMPRRTAQRVCFMTHPNTRVFVRRTHFLSRRSVMSLSALLIIMFGAFAAGQAEDAVSHACAVLIGTVGNKTEGTVHFEQVGKEVKITGRVTGLSPGKH